VNSATDISAMLGARRREGPWRHKHARPERPDLLALIRSLEQAIETTGARRKLAAARRSGAVNREQKVVELGEVLAAALAEPVARYHRAHGDRITDIDGVADAIVPSVVGRIRWQADTTLRTDWREVIDQLLGICRTAPFMDADGTFPKR
jgi:hypothetical protein